MKTKITVFVFFFLSIICYAGIGVGYSDTGSLPVELTTFSADCSGSSISLNWTTATEVNCYGFEIEKALAGSETAVLEWIKVGFVEGAGNSNKVRNYSFQDSPLDGKYQYRLKIVDIDGKYEYSQLVEISVDKPLEYTLNQNFPNPFNPTTKISYSIPQASLVVLKVYNLLGQEVATLVNEQKPAGNYEVKFDASSLASGVYVYRLNAGDFTASQKMLLLK